MKKRKMTYIECPYCGCEYLPEEIYLPYSFFGKPLNIVKDKDGKILSYSNDSVNPVEQYQCDKCNKVFNVNCKLQFITVYDEKYDFNEEWYEDKQDKFILSEE